MELTKELVKQYFVYQKGYLYWKIKPSFNKNIGDIAGHLDKGKNSTKRRVTIKGKPYLASRLIFLWHHGFLPELVDHEDNDTLNNDIRNLRAATHSQNSKNRTSAKNSSSKYLGVNMYCRKKIVDGNILLRNIAWVASIYFNGKANYLGRFKTQELAALAYNEAAIKHHGEFANINLIAQ